MSDAVFIALACAFLFEVVTGKRRFIWRREYWVLVFYVGSFLPSLLVTVDLAQSLFKLTTQIYLIFLALLTASLVQSEARLRRAIFAWLFASAVVALLAIACLALFPVAPNAGLIKYASFHFGTLQRGNYPRLSLTFLNANMACNYLSVSAALLLAAQHCRLISTINFIFLCSGIAVAALATISPGLGGVALVVGVWLWLDRRRESPVLATIALVGGILAAISAIVAMAVTPILHRTAPFLIHFSGVDLVLAPSARLMLWTQALAEFARHAVIGHGIGIDATFVRYLDPSGNLQIQTDAHNTFLNIAAQCGVIGLLGLAALILHALRLTLPLRTDSPLSAVRIALGLGFLSGLVYQGLGGSFEDARHLWVVLGLLMAAGSLRPGDGSFAASSSEAPAPAPRR